VPVNGFQVRRVEGADGAVARGQLGNPGGYKRGRKRLKRVVGLDAESIFDRRMVGVDIGIDIVGHDQRMPRRALSCGTISVTSISPRTVGLEHRIGFGVSEDAFQPVFGIADADVVAPLLDRLALGRGFCLGKMGRATSSTGTHTVCCGIITTNRRLEPSRFFVAVGG
jgi:hypothetical protein